MTPTTQVLGLEACDQPSRSPSPTDDTALYDEHLAVDCGDCVSKIPVTGVRVLGYTNPLRLPPINQAIVDFDKVVRHSGELHALTEFHDGSALTLSRHLFVVEGTGSWHLDYIEDADHYSGDVVWERDADE